MLPLHNPVVYLGRILCRLTLCIAKISERQIPCSRFDIALSFTPVMLPSTFCVKPFSYAQNAYFLIRAIMFIRFISIVIVYASSGKAINEPQSLGVE